MMANQEQSPLCAHIIQKKLDGQKLSVLERTHLMECSVCLTEIIKRLDERHEHLAHQSAGANGANNGTSESPDEELSQLIAQSRRTFEQRFMNAEPRLDQARTR